MGYVKREHVEYLPSELWDVKYGLGVGRRTPLFVTTTSWSRYSWYVRLATGSGPAEGLVRCEISGDMDIATAVRIADQVTATLPRFASAPHKDPRAPENLYPIAGLSGAEAPRRPGAGVPGAAPGRGRGRLTWPSRRRQQRPAVTGAMPTTATGCTSSPPEDGSEDQGHDRDAIGDERRPVAPRSREAAHQDESDTRARHTDRQVASREDTANSDPPPPRP